MAPLPTRLVCAACGYEPPGDDPFPFRCPRTGTDGGDHVVRRILDPAALGTPEGARELFLNPEANPFVRYRRLFHSYHTARTFGLSDGEYVAIVRQLEAAIARVEGHGMVVTPFTPNEQLGRRIGLASPEGLWIKDETGNVAGSHKARHLVGILLWVEVAERLASSRGRSWSPPHLAVASCGNAALAAAVVARAAKLDLELFVPPDAEPSVLELLTTHGGQLTTCPREPGSSGDPCYSRFRVALGAGALPFSCQGSDNGMTIEGGMTLIWEALSEFLRSGHRLDHLVVQVGGGALASSCVQGLRDAQALGLIDSFPRIHTVQTEGAFPLCRAWDHLAARIALRGGRQEADRERVLGDRLHVAEWIASQIDDETLVQELCFAATHRAEFMWPWEKEPRSLARGILDDETYDWLSVVEGMLISGGVPVVVSESVLRQAHEAGQRATGIPVDPTGTAGFAGCLELQREGVFQPEDTVAVLFTGKSRSD